MYRNNSNLATGKEVSQKKKKSLNESKQGKEEHYKLDILCLLH